MLFILSVIDKKEGKKKHAIVHFSSSKKCAQIKALLTLDMRCDFFLLVKSRIVHVMSRSCKSKINVADFRFLLKFVRIKLKNY